VNRVSMPRRRKRTLTRLVTFVALACLAVPAVAWAQPPEFEPRSVRPSTGNRPGFTYRSFSLLFGHCREHCETACLGDPQCRAWTCYHPSYLYEPEGVAAGPITCHLKSETPPLSPRFPATPEKTSGNGAAVDACYTASHAVRLSDKPDAFPAGVSRQARVWRDPNVAASIAAELAEEARLVAIVEQRSKEQQLGIVKPADRLDITPECRLPAGPAASTGPGTLPAGSLGPVLVLSEYGFTGEFHRRGADSVWVGRWPGGCESTTFRLAGSPSVSIEGEAVASVNLVLLREDGDEKECPFSPRLRAEYHLTAVSEADSVKLSGRRIVVDPGSKQSFSWLKNNVAEVTGSARR
jgi:hypothetical protein